MPPRSTSALTLCLLLLLSAAPAFGAGGVVRPKTDGGADGYYYNALGIDGGRYCSLYDPQDFDPNARICGLQVRELDQSQVTPGADEYVLFFDMRFADPNCPGYADLTPAGLIERADANTLQPCSRDGQPRSVTFNGGTGVPDPQQRFFLTAVQPPNFNPADPVDFCGILLDSSSNFVNSSRVQGVQAGGPKQTIGINHFLEAVVFEPKPIDLNLRMSGSSRFPGDIGLPVFFARRECNRALNADCRINNQDNSGGTTTTDDFMTARFRIDNNTVDPVTLNIKILGDRRPINGMPPREVTNLFRPLGGGPPIMNPITLTTGRTFFNLEIKTALARPLVRLFPVNVPFIVRLEVAVHRS